MSFTSQLGTPYSRPGSLRLGANTAISGVAGTSVVLTQEATASCDYYTAFDRVITAIGLTADSQGDFAMLHLLLQCAAYYADRNDVYTNPFREVLRRLHEVNVNPHALRYVESVFNSFIPLYDAIVPGD